MDVEYLTVDQVLELHRRVLSLYGGLDGVRSEHQLGAAVLQPQTSAFGEDAYSTIPDKAAAYGYFMAENQPFIDGNKRTGALTMITFLHLNGYELVPTRRTTRSSRECSRTWEGT
jgi:death-on-curing protein